MIALEWAAAPSSTEPPAEYYCRNDSEWRGRFEKFVPYVRAEGVTDSNLPLVASVLGEVGDNCFAHNVAAWPDLMGCWFEWSVNPSGREVRWIVADRGRGILSSLAAVRPELQHHRDALRMALSEQISGRQPEDRGRGLKVALRALAQLASGIFTLRSGDAEFSCTLPYDENGVAHRIQMVVPSVRGTYCTMVYRYAN